MSRCRELRDSRALTVRIDKGEDVHIVVIADGRDSSVISILRQEIVGEVLDHLGSDPLSGMNVAMKVDGRLGALAAAAPDVDAKDLATLCGGADVENLRECRVGSLKVVEESDVVGVRMVRVEPRQARDYLGRDS